MTNDIKLKKHVLSLINAQMSAHIVKEIINVEDHGDEVKFLTIECKMSNDKIKKCLINKSLVELIQKNYITWI